MNLLVIIAIVFGVALFSPDSARAQAPYTLTVIAEADGGLWPFEGLLPGVVVNAAGNVAFHGCMGPDPEQRCGLFIGRGGPLRLVAGLEANPALGRPTMDRSAGCRRLRSMR